MTWNERISLILAGATLLTSAASLLRACQSYKIVKEIHARQSNN